MKSAAFFSNLLLLEKDDWNENGFYVPNLDNGSTFHYDFFILVRIKPDIKNILKANRLFYSTIADRDNLFGLIAKEDWYYDISGYITHKELTEEIIRTKHILPQNSFLNGKTKMDASNYYIQTGDMHPIREIIKLLNV